MTERRTSDRRGQNQDRLLSDSQVGQLAHAFGKFDERTFKEARETGSNVVLEGS